MERDRDGHGGERGAVGDEARWGMAVRQGRAATSDARSPFHYTGQTCSFKSFFCGFHQTRGITTWELCPDASWRRTSGR